MLSRNQINNLTSLQAMAVFPDKKQITMVTTFEEIRKKARIVLRQAKKNGTIELYVYLLKKRNLI